MRRLKRALLTALTAPGVRRALRPFRAGNGTIFVLHRLTDPNTGAVGHNSEDLRRTLAFLRRRGYELVALSEMFRRLRESGPQDDLGIAFTLDDGYAEQVRVAGPIFAEFDCPATVYVTTGFLDQTMWMWWDRIEFIVNACRENRINTTIDRAARTYDFTGGGAIARAEAVEDFVKQCKLVSEAERHAAIARLAEAAGVAVPEIPPPRYAPMTWQELRSWEGRGMTFGPHTVTHPILSRTGDEQCRNEISGSWQRLVAEARQPVPIFCYPNGNREDFGPREMALIRAAGLEGGLSTIPGHANIASFRAQTDSQYQVSRLSCPSSPREAALYVSGVDHVRHFNQVGDPWRESDSG